MWLHTHTHPAPHIHTHTHTHTYTHTHTHSSFWVGLHFLGVCNLKIIFIFDNVNIINIFISGPSSFLKFFFYFRIILIFGIVFISEVVSIYQIVFIVGLIFILEVVLIFCAIKFIALLYFWGCLNFSSCLLKLSIFIVQCTEGHCIKKRLQEYLHKFSTSSLVKNSWFKAIES